MIAYEMSLTDMQNYPGTNVRPHDFDEYWEHALQELDSIDPEISLIEADFKVPFATCYHLQFTSVKGARIYAKLLRPKVLENPGPAILMFHGYSSNSGGWTESPTKLCYTAMGFTVAAMDCRGQAGLSSDSGHRPGWSLGGHVVRGLNGGPAHLHYRDIFLDTVQLARVVMQLDGVDSKRLATTGQSQGGALALACAALVPEVKRSAVMFPFLCDFKRAWQLMDSSSGYTEINDFIRRYDPRHENLDELFHNLGYIDIQHLACRINAEVFFGTGLSDSVCPPSTQFAAYNKIKSPKSMKLYPDFGHERLPDHADFIFQFLKDL